MKKSFQGISPRTKGFSKNIAQYWHRFLGWWNIPRFLASVMLIVGIKSVIGSTLSWKNLSNLILAISPELIGISITVLILDAMVEKRQKKIAEDQFKAQLVREMGSSIRDMAIPALEELRENGWLADEFLTGKNFDGANLMDADFTNAILSNDSFVHANLAGANFNGAKLDGARLISANMKNAKTEFAVIRGADLRGALLEGSSFTDEQLQGVTYLHGAIMPNGKRYDGSLNLSGDLEFAASTGIDISNENELTEFYKSDDKFVLYFNSIYKAVEHRIRKH
jgi:hypothetical protein